MKIGILAFQQAINYGAALQIYALQETIKSFNYPDSDIYIINYHHHELAKEYQVFQMNDSFIKDSIRNIIYAPTKLTKKKQFDSFYHKHMKLTERITSLNQLDDFDVLIVGSDQVWNTDITNFDTAFVLDTHSPIKKISYAASVGKNTLTAEDKEHFNHYLADFAAISVREKEAQSLLQDSVSQNIKVTLDPTLLLSKEKWEKVAEDVPADQNYILVYALEENDQLENIARKVSEHLALPLKRVIPTGSMAERASLKYATGPAEFLSLVEKSEFVITNSFHGTCFSIIYDKPFLTVPHQSRGGRMVNLLQGLALEDRLLYTMSDLNLKEHMNLSPNHPQAKEILAGMIEESIGFLKNSLNGE